MPNQLPRVLDAIKQDPHGEVARNVCHWLAVNVMGWEYSRYLFSAGGYYHNGDGKIIVDRNSWNPITDANHTRMLVQKVGIVEYRGQDILGDAYPEEYAPYFCVSQYDSDFTHDACQVLRKYHADGTLTDETLEGF